MKNHKIESFEQMILMSASAADTDIVGTEAADMLVSDADNQTLIGLGGNDTIEGGLNSLISAGAGDDRIITKDGINVVDGGEGFDTLQLLNNQRSDFSVIDRGFGIVEISSASQRTFLTDVEAVQFSDGTYTIAELLGGSSGGNTPPVIVDPANTHITIDENTTFVVDVNATDLDGDAICFSLKDDADSSAFEIDPDTGVLTFKSAPDFENPTDTDGDNTYDVTVIAHDGTDEVEITLWVTVNDVDEGGNTPPEFTNITEDQMILVDENQTAVIDIDATDLDGDTLTYSFSDGLGVPGSGTNEDPGSFNLDPSTGVLSFKTAPDFENPGDADGNNEYLLTIVVSDGQSAMERNIVVKVQDVNEGGGNTAPEFTNVQEGEVVQVVENTTAVGDADATDADGDTLTYSISGGADAALFDIDTATGVVSFKAAPDFETPGDADGDNKYDLQLTVSDGNGGSDVKNVIIKVTDANDGGFNNAPVFTNVQEGETVQVAENTTAVGDADATDADGDTLTYSISGGADASLFNIDAATGVVSFKSAPDFENPSDADADNLYQLQLTVADGNGGSDVKNVIIKVTDVNDGGGNAAPVFTNVQEGEVVQVVENTTSVGDADATDADGDTLTYSISGGADAALFTIDSATGVVSFSAAPDFENPGDANTDNRYELQLTVADGNGGSDVKNVIIKVTDANDGGFNNAPVFTNVQEGEVVQVAENTTYVGDADATDADGDTLTYSISGGADAAQFTIDSATGVVSFSSAPDFENPGDADTDNRYELQLTVTDGNGGSDVKNVIIKVTDVDDGGSNTAPVFTNVQEGEIVDVAENTTTVGDADATDADGDTLTYSISGGADAALFTIDSATGAVSFSAAPDFENPGDANTDNRYELQLTVADGNGGSDVRNVIIRVTDVNDGGSNSAPVFTNVSNMESVAVAENTTFVGDADASDADGDTLTFSISGGADASLFTIDATTGQLSFKSAPDFENPGDADANNFYELVLRVSDGSAFQERSVFIQVDDVNEGGNQAPRFTNVQVSEFVYVNENTTLVGDADAADADGDTLTFSIVGGSDGSLFTIDASTGVLSFINAADFENPGDSDGDNSFGVIIRVSDGVSYQDRLVWVELVDVAE